VSAELVADAGTVRAGQAFTLGVRLRLADGWHVYWKNPGASGLPTEVRFRLPVGFSAGPIQWPLPVRFRQPDGEECYGYEREVLLAARIQAPPGLREGAILEFGAESRWLACRELCRLGRTDLRLALPVSAVFTKGDGGFDHWRDLLPAGAGEAGRWVDARLEGAPGGAGDAGTHQLDLVWIQAARAVEWYPVPPETLDISDVRLAGEGTFWKLRFTARELAGQRWEGDTLDSLLVFIDASGRRRGIELPLRLRGEAQSGKASH
jgi:thiol:disulfide interchange protein DsbD